MLNRRTKMRRSNSKARKWLKENGYEDIHFFPHTRFIQDINFQGLSFDLICSKGTQLVLAQVKTNLKPTKKTMQEYKKVSRKFNIICLWINCVDRKGVEVYD